MSSHSSKAETLERLESEREVLRSHATFTLDELLRLDRRLLNFPAIRRLHEGLTDQPDAEDADEHPERSEGSHADDDSAIVKAAGIADVGRRETAKADDREWAHCRDP